MGHPMHGNRNDEHIARFAAAANPKPQSSLSVTRAFHMYAYEKIVSQINSPDPELRLKSIRCCREFLTQPEQQQQCIKAGIVSVLKDALTSSDDEMCCEAAAALQIIATRAFGCQALIDAGALEQLAVLLESSSSVVRKAAYTTLVEASHSHVMRSWLQGSTDVSDVTNVKNYLMGLNGLAFLEKLVEYADTEAEEDCVSMALQLLRSSLVSLKAESVTLHLIEKAFIIQKCSAILARSESPEVLEAVGNLLTLLCVCFDGRNIVIMIDTIPVILQKLRAMLDLDRKVGQGTTEGAIFALMASLMTVTVDDVCKQQVCSAEGVEIIIDALESRCEIDRTSKVILNTLQCISNMSEHPEARKLMRERTVHQTIESIRTQALDEGKDVLASTAERTMTYVRFVHLLRET